eukprot:CAMPEP_0119344722 /NCGR_PEP_ID=MMETSP1333-20130426/107116_1 /TAXON_ID=418940 /ORGANISM="Scyphosphaera apsteinii, Strain RCC1455" /LENGTH=385 /DNA_ID=CAMNT_0007357167 /DNA_START=190 /DNA_END=1347 /DNA_ORIENTATION=+
MPLRQHPITGLTNPRRQAIFSSILGLMLLCEPLTLPAPAVDLSTTVGALQAQEKTVESLFDEAAPSVVYITTFVEKTDRFSMNEIDVPAGTGSGFVWDTAGHIVTNFHVIRNAEKAKVVLTDVDGKTSNFNARLVGYNPDKDVAVLKIDGTSSLTPIRLAESTRLRVGQTTLAIGNPFGLDHSLTVGVVSGVGREVTSPTGRPITNVIQTDAAINPGNSGGALLDSSGRLIGMNTAIFSPSGASAGIGFAIPVDTLKYQVDTLIKNGKVQRPAIGISYVAAGQARALGVTRGVLVLDVPKNSAASKAGLQGSYRRADGEVVLGDVITGINGEQVSSDIDLFRAIDKYTPGETVSVRVTRLRSVGSGKPSEQEVRLSVRLQATEAV